MSKKIYAMICAISVFGLTIPVYGTQLSVDFDQMSFNIKEVIEQLGDEAKSLPLPYPDADYADPQCHSPIVYIEDDEIYKDGNSLGDNPREYKTACSGDVIWVDTSGDIYKNSNELGSDAAMFKVARYSGDVAWLDTDGDIYRNETKLSWHATTSFEIAAYTGDVIWLDRDGDIYKNANKLGWHAAEFKLAAYTGDVVWLDRDGDLYKNETKLGWHATTRFDIAKYTGDVAWLDRDGDIYKNSNRLGWHAVEFRMYPDGRLLWKDTSGDYHID